MKARPILMSAPMIKALLAGTKTQTRRAIKPQPECGFVVGGPGSPACPYGAQGDLLWVRESWAYRLDQDHLNGTQLYEAGVRQAWYWADGPGKTCKTGCDGAAGRVRAARFMPRWASRITLRITDVRVQRLAEISEQDALAEGIEWESADPPFCYVPGIWPHSITAVGVEQMAFNHEVACYSRLWEHINGKGSWRDETWVWALSFEVLQKNVDEVLANG